MNEVPATLLTGYLGAGKTTLLNRILTEHHGRKYAVIVNDFGDINIDAELIGAGADDVVEMANGCLCCAAAADLVPMLVDDLPYDDGLDGILIEASGLANPAPIAQAFFFAEVRAKAKLDGIVAVVDAKHLLATLEDSPEAEDQLACADTILLNKIDLVGDQEVAAVSARIASIAPTAKLIATERCDVALEEIFEQGAFDLGRMSGHSLSDEAHDHSAHDHAHIHDNAVTCVSLSADRPVDADKFMPWMQSLVLSRGGDILRTKGILWFHDDEHRFVFQGVNMLLEGDTQKAWGPGETRSCKLVIIGRNLDSVALSADFQDCLVAPKSAEISQNT